MFQIKMQHHLKLQIENAALDDITNVNDWMTTYPIHQTCDWMYLLWIDYACQYTHMYSAGQKKRTVSFIKIWSTKMALF